MDVYVFGFTDEELAAWPSDLSPIKVKVPNWPDEATVVHSRALADFAQASWEYAQTSEPGGPYAILWRPAAWTSAPANWPAETEFDDFDRNVEEGDWDSLRTLLACKLMIPKLELGERDGFRLSMMQVYIQSRLSLFLPDTVTPEEKAHLQSCKHCQDQLVTTLQHRVRDHEFGRKLRALRNQQAR